MPYNIGMDYDIHDDNQDVAIYRNTLKAVMKEVFRVLVDGGRVALNLPKWDRPVESRSLQFKIILDMEEIGFTYRDSIVWSKNNTARRTAWGFLL